MNNNLSEMMLGLARASMTDCISRLANLKDGVGIDEDGDMVIHIFGVMRFLLDRDPVLMRQWNETITALSSIPARDCGSINLSLERVAEEGIVRENLLDAFKTLHRPRLLLKSTLHSAKFASKALKVNSTVQSLIINGTNATPFKTAKNATALVASVIKHPTLEIIAIESCDLSQRPIISAFVPAILHGIKDVRLERSGIDSFGATLIADCLAKNPRVQNLSLADNALQDIDATKLAAALKINTRLQNLAVGGNKFSCDGTKALFRAVLGDGRGFNSIHDANHFCFIDLFAEGRVNTFGDPMLNRKMKIFSRIVHDAGSVVDAVVPMALYPRLFIFLEGREIHEDGKPVFNPLNAVFQFIREFNATLSNAMMMDPEAIRNGDQTLASVECGTHTCLRE